MLHNLMINFTSPSYVVVAYEVVVFLLLLKILWCYCFQSSEAHPTVMLFALIALEKFSQTSMFDSLCLNVKLKRLRNGV